MTSLKKRNKIQKKREVREPKSSFITTPKRIHPIKSSRKVTLGVGQTIPNNEITIKLYHPIQRHVQLAHLVSWTEPAVQLAERASWTEHAVQVPCSASWIQLAERATWTKRAVQLVPSASWIN